MKRKIVVSIIAAVLLALVVVGALAGIKYSQIRQMMAAGEAYVPPPESVASAVVREESWQDSLEAIGSITAVQGVTVTPEVAGSVSEIAFESGAMVKKGDLLVRLDTTTEEAQLRAIEAQMHLAGLNVERIRQLRAGNTVSQSELDTAEATLKELQANADAIRAAIQKKTLRAPFSGKLGIRQINLGEYLDTGKAIVSLQSLDPVYADFSLPQQELARITNGMSVRVSTDAYPGREFEGTLTAINPNLDSQTRSIQLQATLENAGQLLRPGMFARVKVILPAEHKVLAVPATAVLSAPYGDSVFVIEDKPSTNSEPSLVVRQQLVRTGRAKGDFVAVVAGLKAGEQVASAGVIKLRHGSSVVVNNDVTPKPAENPRPDDK